MPRPERRTPGPGQHKGHTQEARHSQGFEGHVILPLLAESNEIQGSTANRRRLQVSITARCVFAGKRARTLGQGNRMCAYGAGLSEKGYLSHLARMICRRFRKVV